MTAKNYGEMGGFKAGELNPTIEKLVWTQPKGYVTEPVRVDAGFEIFKVEEHTKQGQAELADVENQITEALYTPRMGPAVRAFFANGGRRCRSHDSSGYPDTQPPALSPVWRWRRARLR